MSENTQRTSETRLSEIELTDEQRKRVLALYRESEGAYHDLFVACAHVIRLRDEKADLLKALTHAKQWLEGWASAESELAYIEKAIKKATQP